MRTIARSLAGTVAGILLLGPVGALAQSTGRCTHETFAVDGQPLAATLCATAAPGGHVTVSEAFARGGGSLTRSLGFDVVAGSEVTRAIDRVPLDAVGSPKELQLTIAYRDGLATVEHALLLPGAIVLK